MLNDCPNELHLDIHIVNHVCFLDLTVDCNLSWKFHVNCVNDKIARGVSMLKKCSHFIHGEYLRSRYFAFVKFLLSI